MSPLPSNLPDRATEALRELVLALAHDQDDRLPAERQLAQQLGVSRGRLRSMLGHLADEGLVVAKPKSGWRTGGTTISEPSQTLVGFTEMAAMYGYTAHSEVLSAHCRLASQLEARQLRLQELDPVFELVRRRYLDARPVSHETVVMPERLAGRIVELDMTDRSLFAELADVGVDIRRTDAVVEATRAPDHIARLLGISDQSPVLLQQESSYDRFGRPVFIGLAYYRGDSYRFRSTLWRKPPARQSVSPAPPDEVTVTP